jgi:hypothetical protein
MEHTPLRGPNFEQLHGMPSSPMVPAVQFCLQVAKYWFFSKHVNPSVEQHCVSRQSSPGAEHSPGAGRLSVVDVIASVVLGGVVSTLAASEAFAGTRGATVVTTASVVGGVDVAGAEVVVGTSVVVVGSIKVVVEGRPHGSGQAVLLIS